MLTTQHTARSLLAAVAAILTLSAALLVAGVDQPARADTPITCEGPLCPSPDPADCAATLDASRANAAELHTELVAAQTAAARSAQVAEEKRSDLAEAKSKIRQQARAIARLRGRLAEARR